MNIVQIVHLKEFAHYANIHVINIFLSIFIKILINLILDDKIVNGSCVCAKIENCVSCSSSDVCDKAIDGFIKYYYY